jgi:HSP20 family protein
VVNNAVKNHLEGIAMFLTITKNGAPVANTLEGRIGRLFNDALGNLDWVYRDSAGASWVPPVDILEQPDAIHITAELPGVKPENVKISLENNVLTIHGSKEQVAAERTERVHRYERTYGTFERGFTLPTTVDAANIKASYEHGVLTVTLPKVEKAKPRQIEVQVAAK